MAGTGGWQWLSATRHYRYVPQASVGLRNVAAKLQARKKKELEGNKIKKRDEDQTEAAADKVKEENGDKDVKDAASASSSSNDTVVASEIKEEGQDTGDKAMDVDPSDLQDKKEVPKQEGEPKTEVKTEADEKDKEATSPNTTEVKTESDVVKTEMTEPMAVDVSTTEDVINISEAMLKRTHYSKCTKPYSRLDQLLERRLKQWEVEKKQKFLLSQVMLRYAAQKRAEKDKEETGAEETSKDKDQEKEEDVDILGDGILNGESEAEDDEEEEVETESNDSPQQQCYSSWCRSHGGGGACYSSTCPRRGKASKVEADSPGDSEADKSEVANGDLEEEEEEAKKEEEDAEKEKENDEEEEEKDEEEQKEEEKDVAKEEEMTEKKDEEKVEKVDKVEEKKDEEEKEEEEKKDEEVKVEETEEEPMECTENEPSESGDGPQGDKTTESSADSSAPSDKTQDDKDPEPGFQNSFMSFLKGGRGDGDKKTETKTVTNTSDKGVKSTTTENSTKSETSVSKTKGESQTVAKPSSSTAISPGQKTSGKQAPAMVDKTPLSGAALTIQNLLQGGKKLSLTPTLLKEIRTRLESIGKTQHKITLAKPNRGGRSKSRLVLKKGSLPPGHKFLCVKSQRSLFALEKWELRALARKGGKKESGAFHYNCKMNNVQWPYRCPRPLFKTCWRYRTQNIHSLAAAGVQLRIVWACIRWDDMSAKAPVGGTNTFTTEDAITTKEVLKRRDVGPHGLHSEYLVRKIVVPIGVPAPVKGELSNNYSVSSL